MVERQNVGKIMAEHDNLRSLCNEKESALQVCLFFRLCCCNLTLLLHFIIGHFTFQSALLEKNSLEVRLGKLNDLLSEQNSKMDLPGSNNQVNEKLGSECSSYHFCTVSCNVCIADWSCYVGSS